MVVAVLAAIAGASVGWGVASGAIWPALVAVPVVLLSIFLYRARLVDHGSAHHATPATSEDAWATVHRELARARRHERPLALVRLPGDGRQESALTRAEAIVPYLRRIDRVWAEHGDVNLLLPEADRAAAQRLVERLRERQPDAQASEASIASFPADGLTSGAILATLYGLPLPSVPVPVGVGRPIDLPADVIELRPHLVPDAAMTDRRESSS